MLVLLWTILALQSGPKPAPPPAPDFKTEVDYKAWLEKYAVGGLSPAQNAAADYAAIFGKSDDPTARKMGFNGPMTGDKPVEQFEPWDPAKHPDWEAAYQKTKDVVRRFGEAAAKPYAWGGVRFDAASGEPTLLIFAIRDDNLIGMRMLARGTMESAWRAPGGKLDESAFLIATRTVLGEVRQFERNPIVISQLCGMLVRSFCCENLLRAAQLDVLSDKSRADVLRALKARDEAAPPFEYTANSELAAVFDAIQHVVMKNNGIFGFDREAGLTMKGNLRCNGPRARDETAAHFALIASETSKPYDAETMDRIAAAEEKLKKGEVLPAVIIPSLGRAYQLQLRAEAMRRGTRLVYELLVYRDVKGKWPAKLADLPLESDKRLRIDPFSNQPFAYRLEDGKPLLYSWGMNAKDDGGTTHDDRWGDEIDDADYIIWPVQP